jgi:pilus assembly protein CpaB
VHRRWSRTSKLLVTLALLCGASSFLLMRAYAARLQAERPDLGRPVQVLVAATDERRGTRLSEAMVARTSVPSSFVPPGALREVSQAQGRTLLTDLAAGEVLTASRLGANDAGPVAALVPPGLRGFTVSVPLPAGSIRPGDRVDVLATFGGDRPRTETVAREVEILSVLTPPAGSLGGGEPEHLSVVLVAAPDLVERLAYASAFADLSVAFAGPDEVPSSPPAAA